MLSVQNITVHYGGVRVLSDCSLEVGARQILGVVGPNGSGKTTLLDVVSGLVRPISGAVFLEGQLLNGLPPHRRAQLGIARSFQVPRVFPDMTCLDNLRVAAESKSHIQHHRLSPHEALELVGMLEYASILPRYLSYGQKRLLDLARVLCSSARVLLLDEPSAGVSPVLVERMVSGLQDVRKLGVCVIIVEHNLRFVRHTCDAVIVLDAGSVVVTASPELALKDTRVREVFLGKEGDGHEPARFGSHSRGRVTRRVAEPTRYCTHRA